MLEIQVSDLKIKRYKENEKEDQQKTSAKTLAELTIESKKKDFVIQQLAHTIATLNLEVQKLKKEGGAI